MNFFSTTPSSGQPPPVLGENKLDAFVRSLEHSGTDSASSRSHDGDLPPSDQLGVSPSGANLVEEADGAGKGSEHISLGESVIIMNDRIFFLSTI